MSNQDNNRLAHRGIVDGWPWPLTLVMDRYRGCYSGGRWLAWNCEPQDIPAEAAGEDVPCGEFWYCDEYRINGVYLSRGGAQYWVSVGRGETPQAAIASLLDVMKTHV